MGEEIILDFEPAPGWQFGKVHFWQFRQFWHGITLSFAFPLLALPCGDYLRWSPRRPLYFLDPECLGEYGVELADFLVLE